MKAVDRVSVKPKNLWTGEEHLLGVMSDILSFGSVKENRTGVNTVFLPGHLIRHDLRRDGLQGRRRRS